MRSRRSGCPPSRSTCRTSTRVKNSARSRSPQRVVSGRSADSGHKATILDWTQPFHMWKLPGALMAKQAKGRSEPNGADEHELVAMARGLAEIVAMQNLSELIVDTKDTTITVRRGGGGMPMMQMPMQMPMMQMQAPQQPQALSAPAAAAATGPAAVDDKA